MQSQQSSLSVSPSTSSPASSVSYCSSTASSYYDHSFSAISTLPASTQHPQHRQDDRGQGSRATGQLYECNAPLHGGPSPLVEPYLAHGHSHGHPLGLGRGNDSFSIGSSLSYPPVPNNRYLSGHDDGEHHHRGANGLDNTIGGGSSVEIGLVGSSPIVAAPSMVLGYAGTVSAPISSSRSTTGCTLPSGVTDVHSSYFSPTGVIISEHTITSPTPPNSTNNTTIGHGTLSGTQWGVYSHPHHAEELADYSHGWNWIGTGPVSIPLPAPTATVTSSHGQGNLRQTGALVSASSSTAPSSSVDCQHIKPALATTSMSVSVRDLTIQTASKVNRPYPSPPQHPQPLVDNNPFLLSPTAQLPTPAAMAVLLSQSNKNDGSGHPSSAGTSHGRGPLSQNSGAPTGRSARGVPLSNTSATSLMNGTNPLVAAVPGSLPMSNTSNGRGDNQSREKKHACTMCHKRFDRPSTLRKHLLVHTGEKAFVCETCGRRFGVASNLNRHVRRCILKPVNTSLVKPNGSASPTAPLASSAVTHSTITSSSITLASPNDVVIATIAETGADCATAGVLNTDHDHDFEYQHKPTSNTVTLLCNTYTAATCEGVVGAVSDYPAGCKKDNAKVEERSPKLRRSPTDSSCAFKMSKNVGGGIITAKMLPMTTTTDVHTTTNSRSKPAQKRRRRAPSPSQWIPPSLLSFNLTSEDFFKAAPVPLPPVRRDPPKEERDSWDGNFGTMPYHPREWRGVLPGPGLGIGLGGLGARDLRNLDLGGSSGCVLGRVAVC